ncbi:hypothetical protein Sjap_024082 [Stephania japonica]|uniref:Uncharacterized protein n=1 Tax=Stephania japonica TaxID=461633 RepID=A0AAP0EEW4_9MAGN
MAMPTTSPTPAVSPQVVGNAFVEQYYHILHQSPELVYRFYQDSSVLSRPGADGVMETVKTMEVINDKILSMDFKDYKAEIITVDAQESFERGVLVLVTGCLTGKDCLKMKFAQSFFLAPQDNGYFVLNDVFRYVNEGEALDSNPIVVNVAHESTPVTSLTPDAETSHATDLPAEDTSVSVVEVDLENGEVYDPPVTEEASSEVEIAVTAEPHAPSEYQSHPITESSTVVKEDAPKKSYASILKAMNAGAAASVPANTAVKSTRAAPVYVRQNLDAPAPAPEPVTATSNKGPESSGASENDNTPEEVEGFSIYIRNLPMNATPVQVEEEFKKFGSIKPGGVQVRSNKGFCFGFVEFEALSSVHGALEASPVNIGGRQAFVEEKRTTSRAGSGRGRFPAGRGGARNENFRGRGNYGGGRGYGRNEFGSRGDGSGRPRGSSDRGGSEGYQRSNQNESGRGSRQGGN